MFLLNNAQEVQIHLFYYIFWHKEYIAPPKFCTTVCFGGNPVSWSIFTWTKGSHWHPRASCRNKITLSALYRGPGPATLGEREREEDLLQGDEANLLKHLYIFLLFACCHLTPRCRGLFYSSVNPDSLFTFVRWCHPFFFIATLMSPLCVCIHMLWFVWTLLPHRCGLFLQGSTIRATLYNQLHTLCEKLIHNPLMIYLSGLSWCSTY